MNRGKSEGDKKNHQNGYNDTDRTVFTLWEEYESALTTIQKVYESLFY